MRPMKDSGIAWVGTCPTHWQVMGNKYIMHKIKHIQPLYQGEDILSLSMKGVIVRDLEAGGKMPTSFNGYQTLYPGNLLMCLFDYDVTPRCIGLIKNYGVSSPAYSQFELDNGNVAAYFYYYYLMVDNEKSILHLAKNLRHSFTEEQLGAIAAPVPPVDEQRAIAAYLDAKCAEIDGLAEDIRAEIATLEEYKKSLITEAVTKGIRGNRPMKDSGVEWIGEIPEEWGISKVGRHYQIILGKMLTPSQKSSIYTLEPYYCAADVHFSGVAISATKHMWFSPAEKSVYLVKEGDMLVVEGGAGAGGCAIVKCCTQPTYIQNSIMIVRSKSGYSVPYICFWLEVLVKRSYVDVVCNKATIPHFTKEKLSNVPIPTPSVSEQTEIAAYLEEKCGEIDACIELKREQLGVLEEYKKSVIYEYVTGKKGVESDE